MKPMIMRIVIPEDFADIIDQKTDIIAKRLKQRKSQVLCEAVGKKLILELIDKYVSEDEYLYKESNNVRSWYT